MADTHSHDAQVHQHEHTHVTHYLRHGQQWEHMGTSHDHEHNHTAVIHVHEPHQDPDKEHGREAHIHDHEQPAQSSRKPIALPPLGTGAALFQSLPGAVRHQVRGVDEGRHWASASSRRRPLP